MITSGTPAHTQLCNGPVGEAIEAAAKDDQDLIVMSTNGRSGFKRLIVDSVASQVIHLSDTPILLLRLSGDWHSHGTGFKRLLVAIDGSDYSEMVLPFVRLIAQHFSSEVLLLSVPVGNPSESYRNQIEQYLENVAAELREDGVQTSILVEGSGPARTIVRTSQAEMVDLIMLATQGRGGFDKLMLGSVAERVIKNTPCPVFLVPIVEE